LFIPQNELVEKVYIQPFSISNENFMRFANFSIWMQIWDVCLTLTICKYLDLHIPDSYKKILNDSKDISDILNIIISESNFFLNQNRTEFQTQIAPFIRTINRPVSIYIDSLDQALGQFIHDYIETNSDPTKNQLLLELWSNSQLGLLYAINQICQKNRLIKIYASIRQEAFEMDNSDIHLQIEDFTTVVRYSKNQLRQIFIINIEKTEKSKLYSPYENDPFIRFIGLNKISHPFILDEEEDIFDFIYRQTFGRPREIVRMGRLIYEMDVKNRKMDYLIEKTNTLSYNTIFDQFKKEVIPYFDEEQLINFLKSINSNVFSKEEASKLNKELMQYYYKLGLIGAIKKDAPQTGYIQEFREAFKFSYKKTILIPESLFFVTHPSLDYLITAQLNKKYHTQNIIGYNYVFKIPIKHKKRTFTCCHFGVGNLGTGLVLPYLFKAGSRILLINRISDKWKQVINSNVKHILFTDSNNNEIKFTLLHDSLNINEFSDIIRDWKNEKLKFLFILSDNKTAIKNIIENIDYITTALKMKEGYNWCSDILNNCNFTKRVTIYPFENDTSLVQYFNSKVHNIKEAMIKEVIADRICSEIEILHNDTNWTVHSNCESYGLVIVNDNRQNMPFNSRKLINGSEIILCKSIKEFKFLQLRKFWLFNCTHAILSCFIYGLLNDRNIPKKDWEKQYINVFKDTNQISEKIELIIQAQILRLIHEMDSTIKSKLYCGVSDRDIYLDLFKYSQKILERIFSKTDQLFRVLPLEEFSRKYDKRIKELIVFYNNDRLYQSVKKTNVFEDEDSYRKIRKVLIKLQEAALNISIKINSEHKNANIQ
jgi:hypothetical protein